HQRGRVLSVVRFAEAGCRKDHQRHLHEISWGPLDRYRRWHAVVGRVVKQASRRFLVLAAPLFEEERCAKPQASFLNSTYPLLVHRSGAWSTFAADDRPMDIGQVGFGD